MIVVYLIFTRPLSVTGLTGTLNRVSVGIADLPGSSSGSDAGMRINIHHNNGGDPNNAGDYCQTGPFPSFGAGETLNLYQSRREMGTCANMDFEVGVESIGFSIFSSEKVRFNWLELRFSTKKGQVTFTTLGFGSWWIHDGTTSNNRTVVNHVTNPSRKFRSYLYRSKRSVRQYVH